MASPFEIPGGGEVPPNWAELLFRYLPDPVFIYDHSARHIVLANGAALARYGYTEEEFVALGPWDVEAPFEREVLIERIDQLAEQETMVYSTVHRTRSGERFPVEMHTQPFREGDRVCFVAICRDLTERRAADLAKERAEDRYQSVFDLSLDCLGVADIARMTFVDVNPAFTATFECPREAMIGAPILPTVHPDDVAEVRRLFTDVLARGNVVDGTTNRIRAHDGSYRWMRWSARPDAENQRAYLVGRDVTQEIREETLFQRLVRISPVPTLVCDHASKIEVVNQAFVDLFGYGEDDLGDIDDWGRLLIPDPTYRQEVMDLWERHYRQARGDDSSRIASPELRLRARDGVERRVVVHCGLTEGHIILAYVDLTDLKLAEEALRAKSGHLALHIEKTPVGVVEWDREFHVTAWNPAAERIFGYSADEVIDRSWKTLVPPEAHGQVDAIWHQLLKEQGGRCSTNENVRKDGTRITCDWFNTPIVNREGQVSGAASFFLDVTANHQRERDLIQAREEAERANRAKSEFLSIMSHELRTPLNAIIAPCEIMRDELGEVPLEEFKGLLRIMSSSANHLLDLINSVLDLAKIESGRSAPELADIAIADFLDERLRPLAQAAERKRLEFRLVHDLADTDRFRTDQRFLLQILINLVGNALKFTEAGFIEVRVEPGPDGQLRFFVRDSGIGIPPDAIDKVFDPFQQVDMSMDRKHEGAGLGLAICRRLAESLEGDLRVESELGKGSTFVLTLPGFLPAGKAKIRAGTVPPFSSDASALSVPKPVLLVEDDVANQQVWGALLKVFGVTYELASSGSEAVERFSRKPYRVILMDIQLPGMNGLDASRAIRRLPGGKEAWIIAQTAYAMDEQRETFLAGGVDAVVTKPVTRESLHEAFAQIPPGSASRGTPPPEDGEDSSG